MHWIFLVLVACLVFMASYNPRTGNLNKFLDLSQSESDTQRSGDDSNAKSAPEA